MKILKKRQAVKKKYDDKKESVKQYIKVYNKRFAYLKPHNKFYQHISIAKGLSSEDMFRISNIAEIQGQNNNVTEKIISHRKNVSENRNDTDTEYVSVEDPLNMYITALR